jgi:two-component system response regulator NreC
LPRMAVKLQLAPALGGSGSSSAVGAAIRVVLADDHRVVRRTLRLLLGREGDIEVVSEASDLQAAVRHVKRHAPHALLLDLRMPGRSSIEAIGRLRAQAPETEIVVVTMEDNPEFARRAIDAGAVGYVLKDGAADDLLHAIRCAVRGEEYLSPRIAAGLNGLRRATDIDGLSLRETEVLRLIALGLTSDEIADELHLSRRTVDAHRRRIHRKLGLGTRWELVRYAIARNLIGDPEAAAR